MSLCTSKMLRHRALVLFAPHRLAARRGQQLDADANLGAGMTHAAGEHRADAEVARHIGELRGGILEPRHRGPAHHAQRAYLRQLQRHLLGHTGGEVRLPGLAEILEGQHGDATGVRRARASGSLPRDPRQDQPPCPAPRSRPSQRAICIIGSGRVRRAVGAAVREPSPIASSANRRSVAGLEPVRRVVSRGSDRRCAKGARGQRPAWRHPAGRHAASRASCRSTNRPETRGVRRGARRGCSRARRCRPDDRSRRPAPAPAPCSRPCPAPPPRS